jgi:CHAD domain-containing protein
VKTAAAAPAKWSRPAIAANVPTADAFATLCRAALAQIAANSPGVARGDDAEYLHQLRVGLRRLLSAMRAFRPLLRRKRADAMARPLRGMMRVFGTARDWDVFCLTLGQANAKALVARANARRGAASRAARELAGSMAFHEAQLNVLRWLNGKLWRAGAAHTAPLVDYARRSLERAQRKLAKRARRIEWRDAPGRHAVRIAVKRLRYACDFFADCFPPRPVRRFLAALVKLQDTLGQLNDISVACQLLDELREPAPRVRSALARRERALITSAAKDWAALERLRPYRRPRGTAIRA